MMPLGNRGITARHRAAGYFTRRRCGDLTVRRWTSSRLPHSFSRGTFNWPLRSTRTWNPKERVV